MPIYIWPMFRLLNLRRLQRNHRRDPGPLLPGGHDTRRRRADHHRLLHPRPHAQPGRRRRGGPAGDRGGRGRAAELRAGRVRAGAAAGEVVPAAAAAGDGGLRGVLGGGGWGDNIMLDFSVYIWRRNFFCVVGDLKMKMVF